MTMTTAVALAFSALALLLHIVSLTTVAIRFRRTEPRSPLGPEQRVTIVRPVCGIENFIEATLASTFRLDHPDVEILFCVAGANDPVVPLVNRLIAAHPHVDARLLIGPSHFSANPKLNNIAKGWQAASHPWVLMVDSNVLMPRDAIARLFAAWTPGTGLVSSPPVGVLPDGPWAELECAILNGHQARWQCFADSAGYGFAQGKAMLWRREILERGGGLAALAAEPAEDAAATKLVRDFGLQVRLVARPFPQPLGRRSAREIWKRQVRWGRLRRDTFPLQFAPEILTGAVPPALACAAAAAGLGLSVPLSLLVFLAAWYGAEAAATRQAGWHFRPRAVVAMMTRDVLLPAIWIASWVGDEFEWRGNAMTVADDERPGVVSG
jgi:ceramide glucosyltransferase